MGDARTLGVPLLAIIFPLQQHSQQQGCRLSHYRGKASCTPCATHHTSGFSRGRVRVHATSIRREAGESQQGFLPSTSFPLGAQALGPGISRGVGQDLLPLVLANMDKLHTLGEGFDTVAVALADDLRETKVLQLSVGLMWQVKQGDVLRYMILHAYGGIYLDLDIECFSAADDSIANYSVVLQGTGLEGVTNAVMASAPGIPFWVEVLRTCQDRAHIDWPVHATGPAVLEETIRRYFNIDPIP